MMDPRVSEDRWLALENWLEAAFGGLLRKHGGPMVAHSIDVGRSLRAAGADDVTCFAGYAHDVLEDTDVPEDGLRQMAIEVLGDAERARDATWLASECCYCEGEYALSKADRKLAAVARWIAHPDDRVALIKKADVESNRLDAATVSTAFEAEYRGWSDPLHEALSQRLSGPRPK